MTSLIEYQICFDVNVFRIRWYSGTLSRHWYTSFVCDFDMRLLHLFTWLVIVPFACFVIHTVRLTVCLL